MEYDYPMPHFIQTLPQKMLYGLSDSVVKPNPKKGLFDFKHADNISLLSGHAQAIRHALNHLAINVSSFGMFF